MSSAARMGSQRRSVSGLVKALCSWAALVAVAYVAIASLRGPAPKGADADQREFSAYRAMAQVGEIARAPHPVGTPEHDRVRDHIVEELRKLGASPEVITGIGVNRFAAGANVSKVSNIVGHLSGSGSSGALLLAAHYDSVERSPGAGDDAAGVATILETLRAIKAGTPLKNDLYVLITDGEELGLLGARAFMASPPSWFRDVKLVLNFDNRGDRSPVLLFETTDPNHDLIAAFSRAPSAMGSSLGYALYKKMPNDTDLTVLRSSGIAGMNFGMISHFEAYHTRLDTPQNLGLRALQHSGGYALTLAREYGNSDLTKPLPQHSDVFFNVVGTLFVHYSSRWVLPLWAAVTALLFLILGGRIRLDHYSGLDVVKGFSAAISAALLTPVAVLIIGWLQRRVVGTELTFGDTPSNGLLVLSYALAALGVFAWVFRYFRGTTLPGAVSAGCLLLLWVATTALTFYLPVANYVLFWPLAFACIAFAIGSPAASWISAIPSVLLGAPLLYMLFVLLGLNLTLYVVTAVLVSLFCLLMLSLWDVLVPESPVALVVVLASACVAFVAGTWMSKPSDKHPNPDSLAYAENVSKQEAVWYSYDDAPNSWTKNYLGDHPHRVLGTDFIGSPEPVLVGAAPRLNASAPDLQVNRVALGDGTMMLEITARSQRDGQRLLLAISDAQLIDGAVEGVSLATSPKTADARRATMRIAGFGSEPVRIRARVRVQGSCNIFIGDQTFGLPSFTGVNLPNRPDHDMAWYGSDVTTVSKLVPCG